MFDKIKLTLRITTNAFDDEIRRLIDAGVRDLELVGIQADKKDNLVVQAIATYVRMNFGSPSDYERLKLSYDEQKAQLKMASEYGLQ